MNINDNIQYFDHIFREWVQQTCEEWNYEPPSESYYSEIYARLPFGLRTTLAFGQKYGILIDVGKSKTGSAGFRPIGLPELKGPYSWFEKDNQRKQPRPAWEYFIQVAEYIRLYEAFKDKNCTLTFEDDLMDIALYYNNNLKVCCEIKEKSTQAEKLIEGIKEYENAIYLASDDRGNDPLRKAKYIVNFRPDYFYVVSIGRRFEFRCIYPESKQFQLSEDIIPFI